MIIFVWSVLGCLHFVQLSAIVLQSRVTLLDVVCSVQHCASLGGSCAVRAGCSASVCEIHRTTTTTTAVIIIISSSSSSRRLTTTTTSRQVIRAGRAIIALSDHVTAVHSSEQKITASSSGVTRVGDTRGGNWRCHLSIFSWKTDDLFFAHHCHFLLILLGCHRPRGCYPAPFYLSDLATPPFFVNLSTIFPFGCQPPGGCHRGGPPPPQWRHCIKSRAAVEIVSYPTST